MSAGHEEHAHRPIWFYLVVATFLTILTAVEVGPLFELYNLPVEVLLVLSVVKFAVVVALFMHLWDDANVFSQVFVIPLLGAGAMVLVLTLLFWGIYPSPRQDSYPVAERHWTSYSQECTSWLRSSISNRWYCASPPIDADRLALYNAPKGGAGGGGLTLKATDLAKLSPVDAKAALISHGETLYGQNCVVCHQKNGAGIPGAFPPLAGSDYIDDPATHASVIVHGLNGKIMVNGTEYNGAMQPFGNLSDVDIAAIATYERNAWGNDLGVVTTEQVAAAR